MMVRWRTLDRMLPLLLLIPAFCWAAAPVPRVWLVQPQSRILEHDPTSPRLAETKCPTMKKDQDPKSTLPAGGVVDIVWHNPFHLDGPTKFELLSGEEILAKLEPIDDNGAINDKNRSTKAIKLPDFECKSCVLRLTQFTENTDTEVISCADVQVLQLAADSNSSTSLQSKSECTTNSDCGKAGECLKGSCYCSTGTFGHKCEHTTSLTQSPNDAYTPIELGSAANGNSLQWRYDSDSEQLEFAFKMPADSWVALGLRNKEAGTKCQGLLNSKDSNTADELNSENSLTAGLNIRKIVGNYLSTTSSPDSLECGPNEEYSDCPEFSRECESSCEWTLFPESVPSCPKTCGIARCVCKEGYVREANDKNECRPFEFCMALQASTQQCAKNQTYTKCGQACEPSCETMYDTAPCTSTCEAPSCSCDNNYVRHNGGCIFWADCPNLEKRVLEDDESSSKEETLVPLIQSTVANRPRSSTAKPTAERKCAANETWNSCGRTCETDCSKIFDREECNECGPAECACQQGFARLNGTCIYWNDCVSDNTKATVKSTTRLTTKTSTKPSTTVKTTTPKNSAEMPPSDPEMLCFGEYVFPPRCEGTDCQYKLSWAYVPEDDNVEFSLETKMNGTGWTGVGFSPSPSMTEADFIVITSDSKSLQIKDMHADGYNSPKVDEIRNVQTENAVGTHVDGVLKATFLRKRNTGDSENDAIFGDKNDECYYFLFPIESGELAKDGTIVPHAVTPMISSTKICIKACAGQMSSADSAESKIPIPTYTCQNEFHYPVNCSDSNCEYRARWAYDSKDKSVMFEVSSKGIGRWTAIGFSKDGGMENSDVVLGWVYQGKPYILDRFAYGRQLPVPDPGDKQDIYAVGGSIEDDIQTITFKRKLVTKDSKTDLQLNKCYYFLFPVGGGRILTRKSQDFENPKTPIGFHDTRTPERSAVPVCICDENNKPVGEAPTARRRRQADPFDERISPGDLSHLLPAVKKLPGATGQTPDNAFACTDVSLIELSKKRNVRVVDGFALSTESIQPDEAFGGIQSHPAVSVFPDDKDAAMVILRKKVKTDDIADFSFADEMGSLVFASGPIGTPIVDAPFVKTVALNLLAPILSTTQSETISTTEQQPETSVATTALSTVQFETTTRESTTEQKTTSVEAAESTTDSEQKSTTSEVSDEWITDEIDSNCAGSFHYPTGCQTADCKYVAEWALDSTKSKLRLHLEADLPTMKYTGFGFSRDGAMANTDVVIVYILENSTTVVIDQFSPGYGRPTVDVSQDLQKVSSSYVDGRVVSSLVRPLSTNDREDADLLAECHYLIFVPSGGALEVGTNAIRKHFETPLSSKTRFCPSKCQVASTTEAQPATTTQTSTKKPKVQLAGGNIPPLGSSPVEDRVFDTVLRVMGRDWNIPLENIQSPESKQFTSEIVANLQPLVAKKWKSLKSVDVTNYAYSTSDSIGVTEANNGNSPSILALTQFTFGAKDSPNADELRDYLKEVTAQSLNGQLNVDPNAVQVKSNEQADSEDKWQPLRDVRNWTIIGIAVLVLLSLIFFCLCCGFCGGRRKTHPEMPFGQPPHSSYHHYSSSYPNMGTMTYEASKADSKGTASTDTQNSNGNSVSRRESQNTKSTVPRGVGETTYQEWYSKVASKDTPSHHQESMYQTPPTRMLTNAPHGAYVTYPNDPSGYYTLNGDNRMAPPPSYYRHY